jgi:hypothetical protein
MYLGKEVQVRVGVLLDYSRTLGCIWFEICLTSLCTLFGLGSGS